MAQQIRERIEDYFDGIVEIEITAREQDTHDQLVRVVRKQNRMKLMYLAKKIRRELDERD